MQIKTTLRFYLTLVRMAMINKASDSSCWLGGGVGWPPLHCWWKCKLVQPLWKSVWCLLRKMGLDLPQDPALPVLDIHPKDVSAYHKHPCSTMLTAALFIIAGKCKQPRCPSSDKWIRKTLFTQQSITQPFLKTEIMKSRLNGLN